MLNDAIEIYFGDAPLASAFVPPAVRRGKCRDAGGVFRVGEDGPEPRGPVGVAQNAVRRSEFGPKTAEEIIERVGQCVRVLDTVGCATLVGKSDGCFATRATCLGAASIKRPTTQCQHESGAQPRHRNDACFQYPEGPFVEAAVAVRPAACLQSTQ